MHPTGWDNDRSVEKRGEGISGDACGATKGVEEDLAGKIPVGKIQTQHK